MKSKTSFIDKGILYHDFKSTGWIGVIYLLGLLFSIPLKLFMLHSQEITFQRTYTLLNNPYAHIFQMESSFELMLLLFIPVITSMLLFRYLQSAKAVDMIHALPLKRQTIYNTHIIAGIIFLFVPVIITALLSYAVISGLGIEFVGSQEIMTWLWISLLMNLLLFISSVAVGMFTGMSSLQGVFTYIMFLFPTGLSILILNNLNMYVYGFAAGLHDSGRFSLLGEVFPLLGITEFRFTDYSPPSSSEAIVCLVIIMVLYIIGSYVYKKRNSEMAGNAIAFEILQPIFKYGVSFCTMLLFGSYFYLTQESLSWTYFGYFLGSLIGLFLAEILIKKSISIFNIRLFRQYACFALAVIILLTAVNNDILGYEKRMPDLAEVNSAYFDYSFYKLSETEHDLSEDIPCMFFEDQNIVNIYDLHKSIIANGSKLDSLNNHTDGYITYSIAYQLTDGSMFYRQYRIDRNDYSEQLKPILESKEYKHLHYDIFQTIPASVDMIEINVIYLSKKVKIIDPVLIEQALNLLQKDALQHNYEQMTSKKPPWANIRIIFNDSNEKSDLYIDWNKSDENFGNWLKSIGEYTNARVIPAEDIEYAIVEKWVDNKENSMDNYRTIEEYLQENENKDNYLKITDPESVENCLENYTYRETPPAYNITFLLKNNNTITGYFSEDNAPDFVKQYFAIK